MGEEAKWSHIDGEGRLRMVDVSDKEITAREARAEATVLMQAATLRQILDHKMAKGNVLEAARLAGIMAAKRTWELIPLCHPIALTGVTVDFAVDQERSEIKISSAAKTRERTGVEMEALVAAAHAALTIYDMCKAVDRAMVIRDVKLTYKSGGRSGTFQRS
ncbi:MAG: molybdenum cofactor biosynthesis protein C [Syntrophobacteraceae bacterium CG2_30_61_12]|nr:MAG: molybdenum cofactor biosynthesis protein C [Syntrophobacteraceae bacterium CG2_30_61_12]PIU30986.1 MAG: cyclic pyranopterin monophosphate synthase MoaC [Syntrophobacteraceae bacterium CG07_land_8_20_14_0_80_61_8]